MNTDIREDPTIPETEAKDKPISLRPETSIEFRRTTNPTYDGKGNSIYYCEKELVEPDRIYRVDGHVLSLAIPRLRMGTLDDLQVATDTIEHVGFMYRPRFGLSEYIRTTIGEDTPLYVFGNHTHAIFGWYEALNEGRIDNGSTLIHIDTHADEDFPTDENSNPVHTFAIDSLEEVYRLTHRLKIFNFIAPALKSGLISKMIWVSPHLPDDYYEEVEETGETIPYIKVGIGSPFLKQHLSELPVRKLIGDLDIDYFGSRDFPEEENEKIRTSDPPKVREILKRTGVVTLATSPDHIDQYQAIDLLKLTVQVK